MAAESPVRVSLDRASIASIWRSTSGHRNASRVATRQRTLRRLYFPLSDTAGTGGAGDSGPGGTVAASAARSSATASTTRRTRWRRSRNSA